MQVSRMEICIGNLMIEFLLQQAFKNVEMTKKGDELNREPCGRFEVGGVRDRQQEGKQQTIRSQTQN